MNEAISRLVNACSSYETYKLLEAFVEMRDRVSLFLTSSCDDA